MESEIIIRGNNYGNFKSDWNKFYKENDGKYILSLICRDCSKVINLITNKLEEKIFKCNNCEKDLFIIKMKIIKYNPILI